jgi:hypothetical protein
LRVSTIDRAGTCSKWNLCFYANAGRCNENEVNMARKMMRHKRISKEIGYSSVEMKVLLSSYDHLKIHLLSPLAAEVAST